MISKPKLGLKINKSNNGITIGLKGVSYTKDKAKEFVAECRKDWEFELSDARVKGLLEAAESWNEPEIASLAVRVVAEHFTDVYNTPWFMTLDGMYIVRVMEHPDCVQIPRRELDRFIITVLEKKGVRAIRLANRIRPLQCEFEVLLGLKKVLECHNLIGLFPDIQETLRLRTFTSSEEMLKEQLTKREKQISVMNKDAENMQAEIKELKQEKWEAEKKIAELNEAINKEKEEVEKRDQTIEALQEEKEKLEKEIEELQIQVNEVKNASVFGRLSEQIQVIKTLDKQQAFEYVKNHQMPLLLAMCVIILALMIAIIH